MQYSQIQIQHSHTFILKYVSKSTDACTRGEKQQKFRNRKNIKCSKQKTKQKNIKQQKIDAKAYNK